MSCCQCDIGFSHTPSKSSTSPHLLVNNGMSVGSEATMKQVL